MNMWILEGFIILGVLFYTCYYALKEKIPGLFITKYLLCAVTAWVVEESCILFYDIYAYSPAWRLFAADVPLVVIVVWPAVIHIATALASQMLKPGSSLISAMAAGIVFTDALLIEPIAVNGNLWLWHEPGLFGVPLIGLSGWAYFTFFSVFLFEPKHLPNRFKFSAPVILVLSVVGTHLLLLITWWSSLRWISFAWHPQLSVGVVWIISIILLGIIIFGKAGKRVEPKNLLTRLPAAIFFYGLLFLIYDSPWLLIVYSLAFIPPYIALLVKSKKLIIPLTYTSPRMS